MNERELKELSNNIMGCGCIMFLIPILGILLITGILFVLSAAGILQ
jgi:hypothetical protein